MGAGELVAGKWLLVAARVAPLALWAPSLGGLGWAWGARLAMAALLTAWLAPLVGDPGPWWRELATGGVLAVSAAAPFWAARMAGMATGRERTRIGDGVMLAALCLYGGLGGVRLTCAALVESYAAPAAPSVTQLIAAGAKLIALGVGIALPILVLVLAVEVMHALATRFSPALAGAADRATVRLGVVLLGWAALAWLTLKTLAQAWR